MGVFSSIVRYITTLGGLIGGDVDEQTDKILSTPAGVRVTYRQTREKWNKQYAEVREAVAQLMMVLEQKKTATDKLEAEAADVRTKMKGAVQQYKATSDAKYQQAFNELFRRDKEISAEQEALTGEIAAMHDKVEAYKARLAEMKARIQDLDKQEAASIADIVSSQQIISLNDRLDRVSTDLDDRNLRAIEERRAKLVASAKLSGDLSAVETPGLDRELRQAGMQSEAAELFAAMAAEDEAKQQTADKPVADKAREI